MAFGDKQTADVILKLVTQDGKQYAPLHVHSGTLRKSEFFDAMLSQRWNTSSSLSSSSSPADYSDPLELRVTCSHNHDDYVKCIQYMYSSKPLPLSGTQEAIAVLGIASELLFNDCVQYCLKYLESVPWTAEEEAMIRSCVGSLQIQISPDLSARLFTSPECTTDLKPVEVMGEILGELLSLVSSGAHQKARDITRGILRANDEATTSRAFANVNREALFKELQSNLEVVRVHLRKFANFFSWNSHQINVASSALLWLLDELFALGIADMAVKMFSEEQELPQLMVTRLYQNPFSETLYSILVRLLQALKVGEVVCDKSVRLSLIITWLPVIAKVTQDDEYLTRENEMLNSLEEGLCSLVGTLPMIDQEQVFKIWINSCLKCTRRGWPDLSMAFDSWCDKLRQVQNERDLVSLQNPSSSLCYNRHLKDTDPEVQNSNLS